MRKFDEWNVLSRARHKQQTIETDIHFRIYIRIWSADCGMTARIAIFEREKTGQRANRKSELVS